MVQLVNHGNFEAHLVLRSANSAHAGFQERLDLMVITDQEYLGTRLSKISETAPLDRSEKTRRRSTGGGLVSLWELGIAS